MFDDDQIGLKPRPCAVPLLASLASKGLGVDTSGKSKSTFQVTSRVGLITFVALHGHLIHVQGVQ